MEEVNHKLLKIPWKLYQWSPKLWHRVKYGLDLFLDHFLDHLIGGKHTISIQGGVGCSLLVLREGWKAECYYSGRGERRTIARQGEVRGGCNSKHYLLMELLLDRIDYLHRFFD